ncbi:MAG: T9SS type A sorting domain-containing protein, partial [candidate division Zixibacteria bacterium]|nr:T9SS type A sorting domain-containing protein [candidate division Zixibacteria bacterium]
VDGAQGGGLLCYGGNPQIINNVIMGNEANYGAGMVVDYSGAIIKNNAIYGNFGGETYGGGGFWSIGNGDSQIIIENNTIVENSVIGGGTYGGRGGAMFVWNSTITARNNIMWGNTQSQGDPIALIGSSSADITYCDIEGGYEGEGNLNQNPEFEDVNFLLNNSSPCIDTGNADVAFNDPEDTNNPGRAKWPAMGGLRNDMGAYGGPGSMLLANDFTTSIGPEYELVPHYYHLKQNYPNPFNSSTTIEYSLPIGSHVNLNIYNIMGQKIETLVDEKQNSGYKRINWDASDYSSGIYFYKLAVADRTLSRRMVLLK